GEVLRGEVAAVRFHRAHDAFRGDAAIKIARVAREARQHRGELRLHEAVAFALAAEDAPALRELLHPQRVFGREAALEVLADDEAVRSELARRLDELAPRQLAVAFVREREAGHGAGDAAGAIAEDRVFGDVAARVEVHVSRGRGGGDLAIVDGLALPVRRPHEHEAAAAEVAGL